MPFSVFHISGYMAQFCEQKTQTHAECLIHCYTSNSLAVLELQLSHQSCDTSWTHTSAFNMFLQFADLSANWKRHQSRSLSLSLLILHFFYFLFLSFCLHLYLSFPCLLFSIVLWASSSARNSSGISWIFLDVYALSIRRVARAFNSVCLNVEKQVSMLFD